MSKHDKEPPEYEIKAHKFLIGGGEESKREPVTGTVLPGKSVSKPKPEFPKAAKKAGVTGKVIVEIIVDESGNVTEATGCGHPLLLQAAEEAARRSRFTPTLLNNQPVKVTGTITYNFNKWGWW